MFSKEQNGENGNCEQKFLHNYMPISNVHVNGINQLRNDNVLPSHTFVLKTQAFITLSSCLAHNWPPGTAVDKDIIPYTPINIRF